MMHNDRIRAQTHCLIEQSLAGGDTGNNFLHRLFAFHLQTIRRVITNRRAVQFFVNQLFQFGVFHLRAFRILIATPLT
ncbi:Uncharacterised protein [Shigella flexneri]|nr:Uncharacterised protein [Shigella flexneri]